MDEIRMVDLVSQYKRYKDEIDSAIQSVLHSTKFINGPQVKQFSFDFANYLNTHNVITCANGTDALQLALMALNLEPGDEVITSTFTFIATVEVIALLGLKPVLVDVDYETFNISVPDIKKAINSKTKVIIPVHLFGQPADIDEIVSIGKENDISIIEDTAQSVGAEFYFPGGEKKKCGTIGDIGCFSFFPSKNLGCFGDGGAIAVKNEELAHIMKSKANHGMEKKYHYDDIGVNSRLDTVQAAILQVKLKYLDLFNEKRHEAADFYYKTLKDIQQIKLPLKKAERTHVYHQFTLKILDGRRNELQQYLKSKSIPSMVYYPVPLHLQKAYKYLGYKPGDFPVSEQLSEEVLSIPMHSEFKNEQLVYISSEISNFFQNKY